MAFIITVQEFGLIVTASSKSREITLSTVELLLIELYEQYAGEDKRFYGHLKRLTR